MAAGTPDVYGVKGKAIKATPPKGGTPVKKMSGTENLRVKVQVKKAGK